ncbi:MAG: hypothetical protein ACRDSJ_19025 [Rubrobacteraceae bacterium]
MEAELVRDRNARLLAEADQRRLARLSRGGAPVMARVARKLFEVAVAVEREAPLKGWGSL